MEKKKKKLLTTGLAVALAALLLIGGGTFAYLQGTSESVKNTFETNKVDVTLTETEGEELKYNYNIVPGTTQPKNPKVTVDNTVDAYVFVEVTDDTQGLVDYEIDKDVWKLLDGFSNVYYAVVLEGESFTDVSILKDDEVTYSAALGNSDMLDEKTGELKTGIELTFKAYAIQKEGFTDAVAAYQMKDAVYTANAIDAKAALGKGQSIVLSDDINFNEYEENSNASSFYLINKKSVTIDLNGKTITGRSNSKYFNTIKATGNGTVITINGDGKVIGGSATTSNSSSNNAIEVTNKGKIIINGGTYTVGPDKNGNGNSVVFSNGGDVVINDGFFYTDTAYDGIYWVLNKKDKSSGSITVYGGTFVNCDPSKTGTEPEGESDNFVAEGYKVVSETQENGDVWYTVVKDD
ncbi:SipW-dependent-type signal peptide-containing protein [bacterium 210820-DFI.6.37]|nr:SipW-dependent-type signal peptide-containing protein [bacterium 210820-DFI.6.37]